MLPQDCTDPWWDTSALLFRCLRPGARRRSRSDRMSIAPKPRKRPTPARESGELIVLDRRVLQDPDPRLPPQHLRGGLSAHSRKWLLIFLLMGRNVAVGTGSRRLGRGTPKL